MQNTQRKCTQRHHMREIRIKEVFARMNCALNKVSSIHLTKWYSFSFNSHRSSKVLISCLQQISNILIFTGTNISFIWLHFFRIEFSSAQRFHRTRHWNVCTRAYLSIMKYWNILKLDGDHAISCSVIICQFHLNEQHFQLNFDLWVC